MTNPLKSVSLLRKLVSTARSVTTGQVGLPLGILRLHTILYWLRQQNVTPLSEEDVQVLEAYHAQIIDFPIGDERHNWSLEALQKEDAELQELTALYQPQLMAVLYRIVAEAI
ncbi:DUF2489 domain-containing protein [Hymenobacter metallilatus]|uniref:DUF2489 domain-containing protein n=1 Tax=Hymenobacter metallilatus TaxID=2493666 RepID=A0A3R9M688_9BACT|nr:DUF2489 domain-containing protein [Hymenobacter metallilatus]RSK33084.1 DUF2489 domain-containing protein [Hymenobacter metallilatus]